jgi:hypothetical protein
MAGLPALVRRPGNEPDAATTAALDWLARHRSPGGYWDSDGFASRCREGKCPGAGGPLFDPGLTGLALLAFLATGENHRTPLHGEVVRDGLRYLKGIQDPEGCFGPRTSNHFVYNHALAALAMTEAYGVTQSPLYKGSARAAVDFVLQCRNPYLAWRYGVRPQDNDTSITGWMVMTLRSAVQAGLPVDPRAFEGARAWLDKVTEPEWGRAGYTARGNGPARPMELVARFPADRSESLTAEAVATRLLCGATREDASVRKGLDLLARLPPAWDEQGGSIDFYYWYFGTLAMRMAGNDAWPTWRDGLREAVLPTQRGDGDGCARGSWDPVDPWGAEGGRVYSTAVGALLTRAWAGYPWFEGPK